MELLKHLNWRYATKTFDTTKKVSHINLEQLKKAVQLSVSSYGLQLYKVLIIENTSIRQRLKPASWNQSQITDASHLFVFCNYTNPQSSDIDTFIELTANAQNIDTSNLKGYGNFMKSKIAEMTKDGQYQWTRRQTYLALGNLLNACAELKIDACPMEGFEIDKYNKILGLEKQHLSAAVIASIGYRSIDDQTQFRAKVRKPIAQLFETI